jgi:hypothetical protein
MKSRLPYFASMSQMIAYAAVARKLNFGVGRFGGTSSFVKSIFDPACLRDGFARCAADFPHAR